MLIYLALATFPAVLGLLLQDMKKSRGQRYLFYFISGSLLFLFLALRTPDMGSVDCLNYYRNYRDATVASSWNAFFREDHFEIGFQFAVYVLAQYFTDPQWFFVFTSGFITISVLYFIEHNCEEPALSLSAYIALGLMTFQMTGIRQALAMSFCLFAYEQAKRRHLWRFILLVIAAMLFHQTAIVFFPVYVLCGMPVTQNNLILSTVVAIVGVFCSTYIVDIANTVFDSDYTNTASSGGFVEVTINLLVLFICYLSYRNNIEDTRPSLVYLMMVCAACYIMRYTGTQAAERISFFFGFAKIALIPNALKLMIREHRRYMYLLIMFLMLALFAYRLSDSYFIPYRFFWEVPLV